MSKRPDETPVRLTHIERDGPEGREGAKSRARMVDVGEKQSTARTALARAVVRFPVGLLARIEAGDHRKGPIEEVARVAGILAAKRTAELIPMCHPLGLDHVQIDFEETAPDTLQVRCRAACHGRTGVEMEAMVGASIAALTIYDMVKGIDKGISIRSVELLEKSGGKSGDWKAG